MLTKRKRRDEGKAAEEAFVCFQGDLYQERVRVTHEMNMGKKKLYKHDKYITLSQSEMKLNLNYVWLIKSEAQTSKYDDLSTLDICATISCRSDNSIGSNN